MGDYKRSCPVCDAWTNSVGLAVRDGRPCPHCGAPAELILQIDDLQRRKADKNLVVQLATLGSRVANLERENMRLRAKLDRARTELEGDVDGECDPHE